MSLDETSTPSRGCPFAGRPRLGIKPEGRACVGAGRCGVCSAAGVDRPLIAGRYRVEAFLASGYYADVFRARDRASSVATALKVYVDDPPRRDAWGHEVSSLTNLRHPRIPRLRGALEVEGWLIAAMDLVGGVGLRELVESRGPLGVGDAVRLGIEVGEALEHVGTLGWTYRDLHPRNVHVGTPVGAMLLDFDGARPPGWPAFPSGRVG